MMTGTQKGAARYYILGRVLLFYFCSVLMLVLFSALIKTSAPATAGFLSIVPVTFLTVLLVIVFARWQKLSLNDTGIIPRKKSTLRFFTGFAAGLLMAVAQALIVLASDHFKLTLVTNINVAQVGTTLLLYLLVACREELVFRSYALQSLHYSFGPAIALLVMTTIFILEHVAAGMPLGTAVIGVGAGGLLFGIAALKTKGLALPLGLHAAWNFGQWALGFKNSPGIYNAVIEKGYEARAENIGLAAFVLITALAIAVILISAKNNRVNNRKPIR